MVGRCARPPARAAPLWTGLTAAHPPRAARTMGDGPGCTSPKGTWSIVMMRPPAAAGLPGPGPAGCWPARARPGRLLACPGPAQPAAGLPGHGPAGCWPGRARPGQLQPGPGPGPAGCCPGRAVGLHRRVASARERAPRERTPRLAPSRHTGGAGRRLPTRSPHGGWPCCSHATALRCRRSGPDPGCGFGRRVGSGSGPDCLARAGPARQAPGRLRAPGHSSLPAPLFDCPRRSYSGPPAARGEQLLGPVAARGPMLRRARSPRRSRQTRRPACGATAVRTGRLQDHASMPFRRARA